MFQELALIIIVATFLGFIARKFKQQLIPAYILGGFIIGPILAFILSGSSVPSFIGNIEFIQDASELGMAFLLFIVGLEISFKKLKDVGFISVLSALVQFALLFTGGFLIANLFFTPIVSVLIGVMLAFGSTMVVINILTKRGELETLHGRIALTILLVQDVIAIFVITLISGFSASVQAPNIPLAIIISILKGVFLILLTLLATKIFPFIFKFAAKTQELLFLCSLSVAFLFALIADKIGLIILGILNIFGYIPSDSTILLLEPGFSIAIGTFLGGIALGSLIYSVEISSKISPLKEFFSTIFFVSLGMKIQLVHPGKIILPLIAFLLFLIIIKPLVISSVTALFGFEKRTSFLTGITLFQVSEFAIIMLTLGSSYGILSSEVFSLIIVLTALTMIITTYTIEGQNWLYDKLGKKIQYLHFITKNSKNLEYLPDQVEKEVLLIGYNRMGYAIFETLKCLKKNFLILDYNPVTIKKLIKEKIHCIYGDANDSETLEKLHLRKPKIIISTVPDFKSNMLIIKKTREVNKKSIIFVTSHHAEEALELYEAGADYVILPHFLGGNHVSLMLEDISTDISKMVKHKFNHIYELNQRGCQFAD